MDREPFFTHRRRLQLFALLAVVALTITVFGQHEVAIGLVCFGLLILPYDWFPRG